MKYCTKCGTFLNDQAICPNCGEVNETNPMEQFPMKWYKFLIYFALFAGAVINFINGVNYATGGIYMQEGLTADQVYGFFGDELRIMDIVYGLAQIALAGFGIYTRFRLAEFKKNGPMCVYITYGAGTGVALLYALCVSSVIGENALNIMGLLINLIVLVCNIVYFTKRKALFVN